MAKHILIIGSGVVGLSTAYYARQRGHRVTVVERGGPDHDCCSLHNAGLIVPSHFVPLAAPGMVALGLKWMGDPESPFYIKPRLDAGLIDWGWKFFRAATAGHVARAAPVLRDLHLASRKLFEQLAAETGNRFELAQRGLLVLCATERGLEEETRAAATARRLDMPVEVLTPAQAATLEPGIRMNIAGAVHYPLDCHLTPHRFLAALARLAEPISWNTEITGWRTANDRIEAVQTDRGELTADEYVVAGGSWSPGLLCQLQVRLPMQPGKGYSLTLPAPRRLPAVPALLSEARLAVTPLGSTLRFGGTMEIAGLDESINPARIAGIVKSVPKYYPEFGSEDFRDVEPWSGLRPCSPDGLPYVGRCARYANLSVATGHAMMGLSLGPITGKLMAEILSGETPSIEISLLRPDRYA